MKYLFTLVLILVVFTTSSSVLAADQTTKRRPDQTEFVTETHVRLTTDSLTVAEVQTATAAPTETSSLWDYLTQSVSAFLNSLRDIFNLN